MSAAIHPLQRAASTPRNAQVLIEARAAAKTYRTQDGEVETLKPLDFEIRAGEFVSVIGPSGCGKSTLMKLVAGLLPLSGGELRLSGQAVRGPQTNVGIVFQNALLLPWRSVVDNILLQAEIRGLPMNAARTSDEHAVGETAGPACDGRATHFIAGGGHTSMMILTRFER